MYQSSEYLGLIHVEEVRYLDVECFQMKIVCSDETWTENATGALERAEADSVLLPFPDAYCHLWSGDDRADFPMIAPVEWYERDLHDTGRRNLG